MIDKIAKLTIVRAFVSLVNLAGLAWMVNLLFEENGFALTVVVVFLVTFTFNLYYLLNHNQLTERIKIVKLLGLSIDKRIAEYESSIKSIEKKE